jgi:lysophospholipase L1-like esterase
MNQLKYLLLLLPTLAVLPLLYIQARMVKKKVPELPEAAGLSGTYGPLTGRIEVLFLGESHFAGAGVSANSAGIAGRFAFHLSSRLKKQVNWQLFARNGYTIRMIREQILPQLPKKEINLIMIGIGANDTFHLNSPHTWRDQIVKTILELKKKYPASVIVFANMPPVYEFPALTSLMRFFLGKYILLLGAELEEICKQFENVYFSNEAIRIKDWLNKTGDSVTINDFFSDGVHPSALIYDLWAADLSAFTEKLIQY